MPWSVSEAVLKSPALYILFQRLVGADRIRQRCIEMLHPAAGQRLLDVGCGPAYYFESLPAVDYHGFDTEPRYIDYARARYGDRGRFYCEQYGERQLEELGKFDGILLLGLLHHLDDDQCAELLTLAGRALKPGGSIITADPCYFAGQSRFSRFMISKDRGKYVAPISRFLELGRRHFEQVDDRLLDGVTRIPYPHVALRLTRPRLTEEREESSRAN